MVDQASRLLDPELLARLKSLHMRARRVVDGVLTGLHRSPHHGASVEFAEHKEYSHGDEIRHIDWKVFAKSDKYYIKRFEQETNLRAMLLVDASSSMLYRSPAATRSKWDFACSMAAALAYLMLQQQDSVGLTIADESVREYVPPRSRSTHLMHLCELLVRGQPKERSGTRLLAGANHLLEVSRRRGIVFVISDFLDTDVRFFDVLKQLESRRQHVHLLQVLDPWELTFPFQDMTVFQSLETGQEILAEPRVMRDAYLREVGRWLATLRQGCLESGMEYRLMDTGVDLSAALTNFIVGTPQSDPLDSHGL